MLGTERTLKVAIAAACRRSATAGRAAQPFSIDIVVELADGLSHLISDLLFGQLGFLLFLLLSIDLILALLQSLLHIIQFLYETSDIFYSRLLFMGDEGRHAPNYPFLNEIVPVTHSLSILRGNPADSHVL